jgi:hypothetical protein
MFGRDDPKLVVFAFMVVFVSYCPQFSGSGAIYKEYDNPHMFERHDEKPIISTF